MRIRDAGSLLLPWMAPGFLSLGAVFGTVPSLAAQPASVADAASELKEITVTAQRYRQRMQDVPMTVTALSGAALARQNAQALVDVQATIPSLAIRYGSGDQSTLLVSLRGPTQNRADVTVDAPVGIYVDDVVYPQPDGTNAALFDVDSVQVLQGPQGTLFGRNTIGGALLVTTNDPQFGHASMVLSAGAGSYGYNRLGGVFNLPLGDKLAVRVAIQKTGDQGMQRDLTTNTRALQTDTELARIKVLYRPTDRLSLLVGYEYGSISGRGPVLFINHLTSPNPNSTILGKEVLQQSGGTASIASYANPPFGTSYGGGPGLNDFSTWTHTEYLNATYRAPWGNTKLVVSHRDAREHRLSDVDGTPYTLFNARYHQALEDWTGELREYGSIGDQDRFRWQIGAFIFREWGLDNTHFLQWPFFSGPTTPQQNEANVVNDSNAIYSQETYKITRRLSFTAGVRFTNDHKELNANNFLGPELPSSDFIGQADFLGSNAILGVPVQSGSTICNIPTLARPPGGACRGRLFYDKNDTNYTVSVDYKITPDALIYVRHATGYRAGGLNQRVAGTGSLSPFGPETLQDTEAGVKTEWLQRRLRANADVFYSHYDDLILAVQNFLQGSYVTNAGNAVQKGAQATVQAVVARGLELGATYGYTNVRISDINPFAGPVSPSELPGVPKETASADLNYTRELGRAGTVNATAVYRWTDKINYVGTSTPYSQYFTSRAYGLLDLRITFSLEEAPVDIALWGKNVTDKKYLSYGLDLSPLGAIVGQWGDPAEFGVDVTYRVGE